MTNDLISSKLKALQWIELVALISLVLLYGWSTYQRNLIWKDELSLWADIVKKSPDKVRPHHNLGRAYFRVKQYKLSLEEYQKALKIKPFLSKTRVNVGLVYKESGQDDLAIGEYKKALMIDPDDYKAHMYLGDIYKNKGLEDFNIIKGQRIKKGDLDIFQIPLLLLANCYYLCL